MKKHRTYRIIYVLLTAMLVTSCAAPPEPSAPERKTGIYEPLLSNEIVGDALSDEAPVHFATLNIPARAEPLPIQAMSLNMPVLLSDLVNTVNSGDTALDLTIPNTLRITRPEKEFITTFASYFITGTSNPDIPVYFGDTEIQRLGTRGTFGVLINLDPGHNTFTFSQNGKIETVVINRRSAGVSTINLIQQESMFPSIHGGVRAGEAIPVRCIAPSGAEVTATFGGRSVKLTQSSPASPGVPATFTGRLETGDGYESGTSKIGPVTYTLAINGEASRDFRSNGDMYVAGSGAVAVQVSSYAGFVYPDLNKMNEIKDKVKQGARDYITGQNQNYFQLASGGWIAMDQVRIVEGESRVGNAITGASQDFAERYESYTFAGNRPPFYYTRVADGVFYLYLYNTTGTTRPNVSGSRLFSSVSATERDNGSVIYAFKLRDNTSIWGWNVSFANNGALTLRFNYRPKLSNDSNQPLKGIRIMVDAGHGGSDPGALGVAGLTGPSEKTVNLAHAYAIRDRLRSLGATVALTRSQDVRVELNDRLKAMEEWEADMFLSFHHNSMAESGDANKAQGLEIYYHMASHQRFANTMMSSLQTNLGRNNRFVRQSYYRITLMPYCPALLVELGFMSNPLEYERAATQSQIDKVADAVGQGIVNTLR